MCYYSTLGPKNTNKTNHFTCPYHVIRQRNLTGVYCAFGNLFGGGLRSKRGTSVSPRWVSSSPPEIRGISLSALSTERGWVASPALCWQLTIDNWANGKDLRSLICRSVWSFMFDSTLCGRHFYWQSFLGVCWVDSAMQWQDIINIGIVKVWQNVSVNLNDDFHVAPACILWQFFGFVHLSTKTFHLTTIDFRVGGRSSRKGRRICGPAMPSRTSWGSVGFLCVGTGCFHTQVTDG